MIYKNELIILSRSSMKLLFKSEKPKLLNVRKKKITANKSSERRNKS